MIRIQSNPSIPSTETVEVKFGPFDAETEFNEGNTKVQPLFMLNTFQEWSMSQERQHQAFKQSLLPIEDATKIATRPDDQMDLLWMRAYLREKLSKSYATTGEPVYSPEITLLALMDYRTVYQHNMHKNYSKGALELLATKIKLLAPRLPKDTLDTWMRELPTANLSQHMKDLLSPSKDRSSCARSQTNTHERDRSSSFTRQIPVDDGSDRMILNCNPDLNTNQAHIDSNDTMDEDISELELDENLRPLVDKPVDLSIHLADMVLSMFKVVSEAPGCADQADNSLSGTNTTLGRRDGYGGSIDDLGSGFSTLTDFFSRDPKRRTSNLSTSENNASQKMRQFHFVLQDAAKIKSIKKIPTYEVFKRTVVALRHVKLADRLTTDDEKTAFWLNVRSVMWYAFAGTVST